MLKNLFGEFLKGAAQALGFVAVGALLYLGFMAW